MKYWILLSVLPFLQTSEKSAWEIHYIVSTVPVTPNVELAEMLSYLDSTVVTILASDTIKRYHYYPRGSDVQRIYFLTENEDIVIDPQSLKPMESPVELDMNYSIDWNSIIEETGNIKYILGFKCIEYVGSTIVGDLGHEIDSFSRFWIMDLPDERARKLRTQYYLKEGIVLEKESISTVMSTGNELISIMKATSIKRLN